MKVVSWATRDLYRGMAESRRRPNIQWPSPTSLFELRYQCRRSANVFFSRCFATNKTRGWAFC